MIKKDTEKKFDKKYFLEMFDDLCRGSKNRYQVWSDFISCAAISISNTVTNDLKSNKIFGDVWEKREKEYLNIMNSYNESDRKLFPKMLACITCELQENPDQDLLGEIYMRAELGNKNAGQFFTPYSLCHMMAKTTMRNRKFMGKQLKEKGFISFYDCACGGGATLIAARNECAEMFHKLNWQEHCYFVGQDIDRTTAMMCYVQLSLLGCPGYVIVGNTLTEPVPELLRDANNIFFTPMYLSDVWTMRRFFHGFDMFMRKSS